MGYLYYRTGQIERAIEEYRLGIEVDPKRTFLHTNLVLGYQRIGRFDEARAAMSNAWKHIPEDDYGHFLLHGIAFAQNDRAGVEREIAWLRAHGSDSIGRIEAGTAKVTGKLATLRVNHEREAQRRIGADNREGAAFLYGDLAEAHAYVGDAARARQYIARARSVSADSYVVDFFMYVLALLGAPEADAAIAESAKRFGTRTAVKSIWVPQARAALEISRGNGAAAVEMLRSTEPYEFGQWTGYHSAYLRGLAYLTLGSGADAAREFQKIIDRPGFEPFHELRPLALLQQARAHVHTGNREQGLRRYQDFLAMWKDADADIPALREAKLEYAKLSSAVK
ncbi:MAG TPA: hypothetical protein VNJ02_14960 [Vicinamibacterales bacterium]|nr:hypothetical protein [Vicinamibacterales bacterium]